MLETKFELVSLLFLPLANQYWQSSPQQSGSTIRIEKTLQTAPGRSLEAGLTVTFPHAYRVEAGPETKRVTRTVHNCVEYLALPPGNISTGSSLDDRTLLTIGTGCVALEWIRSSRGAAHSSAPPHSLSLRQINVRQLPPEFSLIVSTDDEEALREGKAHGRSLLDLEPDSHLHVESADTATLTCSNMTESLELLAQGDFDGSGSDQLLIRTIAMVNGGSYTSIHLFLLAPKNKRYTVIRTFPDDQMHTSPHQK